jgi:regulatory protein
LERLALRYVERFATTRGRLADYLRRKLRERGWADDAAPADPDALAGRMVGLGYVDDRAYGEGKAAAMARRGLGARRVADTLRAARLDADDLDAIAPDIAARALDAALALARRRRIGPFATEAADRPLRERHLAAMLRGGHGMALSRRIVAAAPGEVIDDADAG